MVDNSAHKGRIGCWLHPYGAGNRKLRIESSSFLKQGCGCVGADNDVILDCMRHRSAFVSFQDNDPASC